MIKQTIKIRKQEMTIYKPDTCRYCNKGIELIMLNSFTTTYYEDTVLCVSFKCPSCQQIIICKYFIEQCGILSSTTNVPFEILGGHGICEHFSNEINEVSPMFEKIFNDAFKAQQNGLNEIVGLGYRRAFEFLVKDFAISKTTDESKRDNIKKQSLSNIINNYFPNGSVKELLNSTSWIGNDFAHYNHTHPDIELEDLKELIKLSVLKIEEELKIKKYVTKIKSNRIP